MAMLVLMVSSGAFAVRLIDPLNMEITDGSYVGSIAPGSTLELIFSKEFGKFDSLRLASSLPKGFEARVKPELESIKLYITVPQKTVPGSYDVSVILSGTATEDMASFYFKVENGLLEVSLNNYTETKFVKEAAEYQFSLINNSYTDVNFTIVPKTDLSSYSFFNQPVATTVYSKTITVPKRSSIDASLVVYARTEGEKAISTKVMLDNTGKEKVFTLTLDAKPSLSSKLGAARYGMPFYSFPLLPAYLIDAFIGMLLN
ncbi:MAG: hypothetical protein AABW59_04195 [archaeon]